METLINLLTATLPLLYGLAAVNYGVYFVRIDPFAERSCTRFLFGTFLLHLAYLLLRIFYFDRHLIIGLAEVLTMMAIAVTGVYLYVERIQQTKYTGAFIIPLVVVLQLFSSTLMPKLGSETIAVQTSALMNNPLFALHTVTAVLGYTAFAVGAVYGVMFLLMYRALKAQRFGLLFERLPSLEELANMGFWATFLGWVFLSVTLGLGVAMSVGLFPSFYKDPQFITSVMVWLVYGAAISTHFLLHWRGARSVTISLVGFVFAVVAMMGSEFLWSSFHVFQT